MKNRFFYLLLFPLLMGGSCKKDNDEIKVDFSCKLNGSSWNPYNDDFKLREAEAHLTNNGTELFVKAINTKSHEDIGFGVYTQGAPITIGKYKLNMPTIQSGYYSKNDFKGEYTTKTGYEGEAEIISIDKTAKKITGRFSFRCFNETTGDSVDITEGQFNLLYVDF